MTVDKVLGDDVTHRGENHIVYEAEHKVKSKTCKVNLNGDLYQAMVG